MSVQKGLTIRANDQIVANVYKNITDEFINYRGLTVKGESTGSTDFSQEIFSKGHIVIDTVDQAGKTVYIVLFHFISSDLLKAVDIKKLVAKFSKNGEEYEIILVTQNQVSTHVTNYIKEAPVVIYAYTYCNFIIVVPNHILVPKYRVLDLQEQDQLVSKLFIRKNMLPKIKKTDPCVVWSTAKVGDILEFMRADEVVGTSVYYRVVV
jgi:DNA-directed RNA polymerase subunit H (RpoH/RPB5)